MTHWRAGIVGACVFSMFVVYLDKIGDLPVPWVAPSYSIGQLAP